MSHVLSFINAISEMPLEFLALLLAMGILIFAGYCVHVVHVHHNRSDK